MTGIEIMFWLCATGVLFCAFMQYRNMLVYRIRGEATDVIFAQDNWKALLRIYDEGASYEKQLWQFTKTKLIDFYPDLEKLK